MVAIRRDDRILAGLLFLTLALPGAQPVLAQDYPSKTVRIVASEAGGGGDLASRVVAQALGSIYGQAVVVDNRSGGVIAGEVVSKSPPDGHTLLHYGGTLWLLPLMRKDVPYVVAKDFAPITLGIQTPLILTVHPAFPANSSKELIALAKARPGQINYGSAALGTANHLAAELFNFMAGVNIVRIGYKGATSAQISTMVGETQVFYPVLGLALEQMKLGKLKGLAVTSEKPSALAPGVPTLSETLPGYESVFRTAFFAPAGTPAALIARLNRDISQVLQRPDIKQKLLGLGMEVITASPQETDASIKAEIAIMGKVIAKAGIKE
jgi:tripartite-type tricarboxylate transporter receptor subunit TctC